MRIYFMELSTDVIVYVVIVQDRPVRLRTVQNTVNLAETKTINIILYLIIIFTNYLSGHCYLANRCSEFGEQCVINRFSIILYHIC
jgi:hypothetical protein